MGNKERYSAYEKRWNNSGGALKFIKMIILIFAVFLLFIMVVFLALEFDFINYLTGTSEAQDLNVSIKSLPQLRNSSFGSLKQFYPNMKFNHNNISYFIHTDCPLEKNERMNLAFNLFSEEIRIISFIPVFENEQPDVEIICSPEEKTNIDEGSDYFIAGEGGAKEIIQTGRYNVITKGVILLYGNPQNAIKCDYPNTELHELIHVFGFDHSEDENSLMYPYLRSCLQKMDDSIVNEVIRLYNERNLPDLYFENASAVKQGRYLDYNITIRNSGDLEAKNITYSIVDDGNVVETKDLKDLKFGSGIILEVTNFKLLKRDSNEIKIVIDYYNNINEIDKTNNVAVF